MKRIIPILSVVITLMAIELSAQTRLYDQIESSALQSCNDEKGNIIPDFSRVGYHFGDRQPSMVKVIIKLKAPKDGSDASSLIQHAINKISLMPLEKRGAILLKKGTYNISKTINIAHSGIVLRGEGSSEDPRESTVLVATDTSKKYNLINIGAANSKYKINIPKKMNIIDDYVPLGRFWVRVNNPSEFNVKDNVILMAGNNQKWIEDLQMNKIKPRKDGETIQWTSKKYQVKARRILTKISGDTLWFENPVPQTLEKQYGRGAVYKYEYTNGIISEAGIENLFVRSDYNHDTHEKHGWIAINFGTSEHCWVDNVNGRYFGYSLVKTGAYSKNITVANCKHTDPKSKIQGGRRYTFSMAGELALFMNCVDQGGRHSFVSSPYNCGPNVFVNCSATETYSDIGPHHRWNTATLYDNVRTDTRMNIVDRGNFGTGHGWASGNNVFWNCEAKETCVQNVWMDIAKNYCIGTIGGRVKKTVSAKATDGKDRPQGVWVSHGKHVAPLSLYHAQLEHRMSLQQDVFDVD